jgi:hypothetical protein
MLGGYLGGFPLNVISFFSKVGKFAFVGTERVLPASGPLTGHGGAGVPTKKERSSFDVAINLYFKDE